jgi:hypothetical protein
VSHNAVIVTPPFRMCDETPARGGILPIAP